MADELENVVEETEDTPVSEIPYPEGTAPPVLDDAVHADIQFTLTEAVIQSAGDISEDTIAEMRKGTAKEALEILHSAEYSGLADAFKNGLSAGSGGGGDTQLPCLYCEVRESENASGIEYVDGSFVKGPIGSVMVVKNISSGQVSIHPTVVGRDRDDNQYIVVGYEYDEIDNVPVSRGLCVVFTYTYDEDTGEEGSQLEGVYSGVFTASLTATAQTSVASGTQLFSIPVNLSNGSFAIDGGVTLGILISGDVHSTKWPTNSFLLRDGFVPNPNSQIMMQSIGISHMIYETFDGNQILSVSCVTTESNVIIPKAERVAYFTPSLFALGVYNPPGSGDIS